MSKGRLTSQTPREDRPRAPIADRLLDLSAEFQTVARQLGTLSEWGVRPIEEAAAPPPWNGVDRRKPADPATRAAATDA